MGNLGWRVVVAVAGIPLALLFIYMGGLPLALFLATLAAVGAWELFRMARQQGLQPLEPIGIPLAAAMPLSAHLAAVGLLDRPAAVAGVLLVALTGVAIWWRAPDERPLEAISVTAFGPLYAGATLAFGYALRHHPWVVGALAGTVLVLYPLVVTWGTDIGAYFIGRWLGKRKLMPSVSPGKTVAGAIGGLVVAVVIAVAYNALVLRPQAQLALAPWTAIAFGVLTSAAAQVGDLAESLFKRAAGVKDSSRVLPGHGGILDRLDSLFFVLPIAYLMLGRLLLPAPR
jgi:phosphatidate cytidylyltransferase